MDDSTPLSALLKEGSGSDVDAELLNILSGGSNESRPKKPLIEDYQSGGERVKAETNNSLQERAFNDPARNPKEDVSLENLEKQISLLKNKLAENEDVQVAQLEDQRVEQQVDDQVNNEEETTLEMEVPEDALTKENFTKLVKTNKNTGNSVLENFKEMFLSKTNNFSEKSKTNLNNVILILVIMTLVGMPRIDQLLQGKVPMLSYKNGYNMTSYIFKIAIGCILYLLVQMFIC